jgi:hypothetical protein
MNSIPEQDRVKKLPQPHILNIQFARPWNVVTPAVYRYENQKWIDEFFETGRMRLSTFAKFATYADEIRGDRSEGHGFCYGETKDNKSIVIVQAQGMNATVLCCSHRLDHKLRESFERDSAFQIMNTVGLAVEIARQLAGFKQGLEGSCIYRAALWTCRWYLAPAKRWAVLSSFFSSTNDTNISKNTVFFGS